MNQLQTSKHRIDFLDETLAQKVDSRLRRQMIRAYIAFQMLEQIDLRLIKIKPRKQADACMSSLIFKHVMLFSFLWHMTITLTLIPCAPDLISSQGRLFLQKCTFFVWLDIMNIQHTCVFLIVMPQQTFFVFTSTKHNEN